MRIFPVFLLFCLHSVQIFADNRVSPVISEVTVYRSGAKVSSVATVKVEAGNSNVIFENLSPYFNPNSLQVKIKGAALLNSAAFSLRTPGAGPEHPRTPVLRDSLVMLGDDLVRINNERDVLNGEIQVITQKAAQVGTSSPGEGGTAVSIADLRELTAFYRQRLLEIRERQLQLTIKERKIKEIYAMLQVILHQLQPNTSNQTGEIIMKIEAASTQTIEITCTYVVTQASWAPLYDLRSEGLNQSLRLIYKANVSNRSGFDWKGVRLHLSTATPLANNNRPILSPVFVDFRVVAMLDDQLKPIDGSAVNIRGARSLTNYYLDGIRVSGTMPPVEDLENHTYGGEDFIANFDLEKPQDILADGHNNIVTLDEQDIPAMYEYHSVPKLEAAVFLLAKITDFGKYNLLPGTANLFFQDTYVGQSWVDPRVAADTLLLSMGRDEQIVIKRTQPKDFTERKKLFGSSIKETYSYEITIKNNKTVPVTVDLLDQIPVSKQKEIEVELEDKGGARFGADLGKLEWQVSIPAGQTQKVRFTYSVKYPKDKAIGTSRQ